MKKFILVAIIFLAFILRFWKLDTYPAFNADEAAIGYNAYSLIQTGRDEHGNPWPIHFESFNDYKPGLYFYLVLPFVKALGLNEWAIRLPGATLGVLTILIMYFLVKESFPGKREFKISNLKFKIEEIASFFLAISPWHIHFSRGGWEVNTATFFIVLGTWLFLKALKDSRFYLLSAISYTLSLYTYHAARIVVPLIWLGLTFIYWKDIRNNLKAVFIAGLISLILLFPLAKDLTSGAVSSRVAGVGLFADPGPLNRINEQRGEHSNFNGLPAKLLHNKVVNYGLAFVQNWASHFHGEFLFLSGDSIQRDKVPETGQMYLFDILFLAVGLFAITRNVNNGLKLVLWWLLVAPTAAALTFQAPHALRAENMVIPLVILSSFGLVNLVEWLQEKNLRFAIWLLVILVIWQFARYEHMYWVHMAKEYPYSSQYGLKELVSYVKDSGDKYSKVWVTDRYDQPYILFLFYLNYPPEKFQGHHSLTPRDNFGFSTVRDFDKFHFEAVNFDKIKPENPNSLIIGTSEEIPKEANIVKKVYGTNGFQYFNVVAN